MGTLIIFGLFIIVSFVLGIYLGQKLNRNEQININPIKAIDDYREEKEIKEHFKEEQSKFDIMLENIDNYDGTSIGQKDVR